MVGHLGSVVVCHCFSELWFKLIKGRGDGFGYGFGPPGFYGHDVQEPGFSLDDCSNGAFVSAPNNQIALPMPDLLS